MNTCTHAPRRTAGSPCPVYLGGIRYRSICHASFQTGVSSVWMLKRLNDSRGAPVFIRGTALVECDWVKQTLARLGGKMEAAHE